MGFAVSSCTPIYTHYRQKKPKKKRSAESSYIIYQYQQPLEEADNAQSTLVWIYAGVQSTCTRIKAYNQSLPLCQGKQGKQGNMHIDNHLQGKQGKHFRNLKPGKGCRPQVHTQCLQVTQVLPGNVCTEPSSTSRSRDGYGERDFTVYGCETNLA